MLQKLALIGLLLLPMVMSVQAQTQGTEPYDPPTCGQPSPVPLGELTEREIDIDSLIRSYLIYVPTGYDPDVESPLVVSLHGFASNPMQQAFFTGWNDLGERENVIIVYPQGTGFPLRWAAGYDGVTDQVDDVSFIDGLIAFLFYDFCLDSSRVYVNGFSNGAGMTHRIACEIPDRIAAVGMMSGAYPALDSACEAIYWAAPRTIPMIAFHGTADPIVPYEGGDFMDAGLPPVAAWADAWVERNGCAADEPTETTGAVSGIRYTDCEGGADVVLYTVEGGGHQWTGGGEAPGFIVGEMNRDVNATELMWEFFSAHPLN